MDFEDIICDECKLIPIALPCGSTLCQEHIEKFNDNFTCSQCNDEHQIPRNGYSINKKMIKIIDNYINFDQLRKETIKSFDCLNETINEYESINPDGFVYDYFSEIRNKVDLHREELKKEIDDKSDEIIKKLYEKEQECKLNIAKLVKLNLNDLKQNHLKKWKQKLRQAILNQDELNDLLSNLNKYTDTIKLNFKCYKEKLLQNESIEFEKLEKSSLFGQLVIKVNGLSKDFGDLINIYNEHVKCINSIQVDVGSNKLISASDDKTIKIWNLETGECLKTLNDHKNYVNCILIISNNRFMSGSEDKTIKIWDLNTYECLNTLENDSKVSSLCLISESQVACSCLGGSIHIWDLNSFKNVKSFRAHDDWIKYLLLVDKTKLVSCSISGKIKVWSLDTFECINVLEGHSDIVFYLELNSKGNLVSCSEDKTIKIWQIETGEMLKSIEFKNPVNCTQLLNDSLLAAALDNGHIVIFDLNKMEIIQIISAHSTFVYRLLFIPNGNLLIGSGSGIISQWKIVD